jgi:hypothetical protein
MTNINAEELRELLIPIPPRPIQDRICKRLAEIRCDASDLRSQADAEFQAANDQIEKMILSGATA